MATAPAADPDLETKVKKGNTGSKNLLQLTIVLKKQFY